MYCKSCRVYVIIAVRINMCMLIFAALLLTVRFRSAVSLHDTTENFYE